MARRRKKATDGSGVYARRLARGLDPRNPMAFIAIYCFKEKWPRTDAFRRVILDAGAVDVIIGREHHCTQSFETLIRLGKLPQEAKEFELAVAGKIKIFCKLCAEDIQNVIKAIREFPCNEELDVDVFCIGCKDYTLGILDLGPSDYQCSSPRHSYDGDDRLPDVEMEGLNASVVSSLDMPAHALSVSQCKLLDENIYSSYAGSKRFFFTGISYDEYYSTVYRMFVNKDHVLYCSKLLDNMEETFGSNFKSLKLSEYSKFLTVHLKLLDNLKAQVKQLIQFVSANLYLENLLMIWDDVVEDIQHNSYPVVFDIGLGIWTELLHSHKVYEQMKAALLELITRERNGETANRELINRTTMMLKVLSQFENSQISLVRRSTKRVKGFSLLEDFEKSFLQDCTPFYNHQSRIHIRCYGAIEYLEWTQSCIEMESELAFDRLTENGRDKVINSVANCLLRNRIKRIITDDDSFLVNFVTDNCTEGMTIVNTLFKKLIPDGMDPLRTVVASCIRKSMENVAKDKHKNPIEYIRSIANEKDKYQNIIRACFKNDRYLQHSLEKSFSDISVSNYNLAEGLSLYFDFMLKEHMGSGDTLDHLDRSLEKATLLIYSLEKKSIFELYYHQHLADRLIAESTTLAAEQVMVNKLRRIPCCRIFIDKLTVMISDVQKSQQLMAKYADIASTSVPILYALILTTASWPIQPIVKCNLPCELDRIWARLLECYHKEHFGRKVTCYPNLGSAVIDAVFCDHIHELNVPMYHMAILVLFNSADRLSFKEIRRMTNIPNDHLKHCLHALSCVDGKKVLRKEPASNSISSQDVFMFNYAFRGNSYQIKFEMTYPKKKKIVLDQGKTDEIDTVIVSILKGKAAKPSAMIVKLVTRELKQRFVATPSTIVKRLKTLEEWEILIKDADSKMYRYYLN